jgi:hypothetical protein
LAYQHKNHEPYWIVVAPAGTSVDRIALIDIPSAWVAAAKECVQEGESALFLAEATRFSCVRPLISPTVRELQAVRKNAAEETVFTLRGDKTGSWLALIQ